MRACSRVQACANFVDTILSKWFGFLNSVCRVILKTNLRKHVSVRCKEVFLTLQILTKEDRQTTGFEKGILTATARVGGHWQMRDNVMRRILYISFIRVALCDRFPNTQPVPK